MNVLSYALVHNLIMTNASVSCHVCLCLVLQSNPANHALVPLSALRSTAKAMRRMAGEAEKTDKVSAGATMPDEAYCFLPTVTNEGHA